MGENVLQYMASAGNMVVKQLTTSPEIKDQT